MMMHHYPNIVEWSFLSSLAVIKIIFAVGSHTITSFTTENPSFLVLPNPGKIEVDMEDQPNGIKISIKDSRIGISEEKQKDLFKKFYQVDASLRKRGESGLGLAICKGIIDNHLGKISVHSSPNQGATFSFTISKEEITLQNIP